MSKPLRPQQQSQAGLFSSASGVLARQAALLRGKRKRPDELEARASKPTEPSMDRAAGCCDMLSRLPWPGRCQTGVVANNLLWPHTIREASEAAAIYIWNRHC